MIIGEKYSNLEQFVINQLESLSSDQEVIDLKTLGEQVKSDSNSPKSRIRAHRDQVQNIYTMFALGYITKIEFIDFIISIEKDLRILGVNFDGELIKILSY